MGIKILSPILPKNTNDISDVFGESTFGSKKAYAYTYFEYFASSSFSNPSNGTIMSVETLPTQDFAYDASEAKTPVIKSQLISGQRYNLFRFETIGAGNAANSKVKIGITNINAKEKRLEKHSKQGWIIYDQWLFENGNNAFDHTIPSYFFYCLIQFNLATKGF
jgi:hypothetical protein